MGLYFFAKSFFFTMFLCFIGDLINMVDSLVESYASPLISNDGVFQSLVQGADELLSPQSEVNEGKQNPATISCVILYDIEMLDLLFSYFIAFFIQLLLQSD